jgi:hypothetical protein
VSARAGSHASVSPSARELSDVPFGLSSIRKTGMTQEQRSDRGARLEARHHYDKVRNAAPYLQASQASLRTHPAKSALRDAHIK